MQSLKSIHYLLLLFAVLLVHLLALHIDIMEVDAAQYASISSEMLQSGDCLQFTDRHQDYLDKPPLLFWLSGCFIYIFGNTSWAYKLPSLLFAYLAIFSTFQLARRLYTPRIAWSAALVLASTQCLFLITNDVRTDTILMGSVIFAIWQLVAFVENKHWKHWFWGFSGIAWAMLAKGPIGIVVPAMAIGGHFLITRQWKQFIRWEWWVGIVLILLWLSPMLVGLYQQYGGEGVRFYFWTQSFGRITGENVWKNDTGYFYFIGVLLWSFVPWVILFIISLFNDSWSLIRDKLKRRGAREWFCLCGFVLPFIALSLSKYKLPHYIFVLYPFAAILTAKYIDKLVAETKAIDKQILTVVQLVIGVLVYILGIILLVYVFSGAYFWIWAIVLGIFGCVLWLMSRKLDLFSKSIGFTFLSILLLNFVMNAHYYPHLLSYQSTSRVAHILNEAEIPKERFFNYLTIGRALDYYTARITPQVNLAQVDSVLTEGAVWIYTYSHGLAGMQQLNMNIEIVAELAHEDVSVVGWRFYIPEYRKEDEKLRYLLKVLPQK